MKISRVWDGKQESLMLFMGWLQHRVLGLKPRGDQFDLILVAQPTKPGEPGDDDFVDILPGETVTEEIVKRVTAGNKEWYVSLDNATCYASVTHSVFNKREAA